MLIRILLTLALAGVAGTVAAQQAKLYRWVDAKGVVHYGDQPAASATEVNPRTPASTATPDTAGANKPVADQGSKAADCQRKRDQLGSYRTAASVSETDGLGNTRTYSPEEKQRLIQLTEKAVQDACGDNS